MTVAALINKMIVGVSTLILCLFLLLGQRQTEHELTSKLTSLTSALLALLQVS